MVFLDHTFLEEQVDSFPEMYNDPSFSQTVKINAKKNTHLDLMHGQ